MTLLYQNQSPNVICDKLQNEGINILNFSVTSDVKINQKTADNIYVVCVDEDTANQVQRVLSV